MKLAVVVLTFNEEKHIGRCIDSLQGTGWEVVVVDSLSTDQTCEIARARGARVLSRQWTNHARQFNWALSQLDADVDWVFRVDADEVVTEALREQLSKKLPGMSATVAGVAVTRRIVFQGATIRFGGVGRVEVVRLFRRGRGRYEDRWMDEHLCVEGDVCHVRGELVDINLNPLSWWTEKHNRYSSLEAVEVLDLEFKFFTRNAAPRLEGGTPAALKRWIKENGYAKLPLGLRAIAYFTYRFLFCLGFLDGFRGTAFHVLQGFWYRFLVDAKVAEVKRFMQENRVGVIEAIGRVLAIGVDEGSQQVGIAQKEDRKDGQVI